MRWCPRHAVRMVMHSTEECGDKDQAMMVKTDQEPAIRFLTDDDVHGQDGSQDNRRTVAGAVGVVGRAVLQDVQIHARQVRHKAPISYMAL